MFVLLSTCLCSSIYAVPKAEANGDSGHTIDANAEYANGSFPTTYGGIWYSWVNVSDTQIVQYSLFSDIYNSPIMTFTGQNFQVENDTEVFVGNTLTLIEIYDDVNEDGIPQANFTSGDSEIVYYLYVNSSVNYEVTPIQKIEEAYNAHYTWGFKYLEIDGFLFHPENGMLPAARVMVDQLGFNYDFSVVNDTSYVKTSFEIGGISEIEPWSGEPPVSLDGLSLSLLFSTVTVSEKEYTAYVNGEPYNSTTTPYSATATDGGQIAVEMVKAYDLLFDEAYNLTDGENVETHEVKSEAAATSSVPQSAYYRLDYSWRYFDGFLNISDLFPSTEGIGGDVNVDYSSSTLLYRICYPTWDGLLIQHDPTYIAYLFGTELVPEFSSWLLPSLLLVAALVIVVNRKRMLGSKAVHDCAT